MMAVAADRRRWARLLSAAFGLAAVLAAGACSDDGESAEPGPSDQPASVSVALAVDVPDLVVTTSALATTGRGSLDEPWATHAVTFETTGDVAVALGSLKLSGAVTSSAGDGVLALVTDRCSWRTEQPAGPPSYGVSCTDEFRVDRIEPGQSLRLEVRVYATFEGQEGVVDGEYVAKFPLQAAPVLTSATGGSALPPTAPVGMVELRYEVGPSSGR